MPTNNCAGTGNWGVDFKMSDNTPGAILQPHPPPCERLVRRGSGAAVLGFIATGAPGLRVKGGVWFVGPLKRDGF